MGLHFPARAAYSGRVILRERDGRVEAISQHAHSWLSGQLGRQWAWAHPLGVPGTRLGEEFLLGTAEHDLGYLEGEESPPFNPVTGRPFDFLDLPPDQHVANWRRGICRLEGTSALGALMVSRHACLIFERHHHPDHWPREQEVAVHDFLEEQRLFQEASTHRLTRDAAYAALAEEAVLAATSNLLLALDLISLHLAMDTPGPASIPCPGLGPTDEENLVLRRETPNRFALTPWPFHGESLPCQLAVRSLEPGYESRAAFVEAWPGAMASTWRFVLVPGEEG